MSMKRLGALLIVGAALAVIGAFALAGTAQAHHRHHQPAQVRLTVLALAQGAAIRYWGSVPCGGSVTIVYRSQDSEPTDATDGVSPTTPLWAWVTFDTPTSPEDWSEPSSTYTDCVVSINSDRWTTESEVFDFATFCGLIVHEYGHLFGHPDLASDPTTSITYPYIGSKNEHVSPCVERYRADRLLQDYWLGN